MQAMRLVRLRPVSVQLQCVIAIAAVYWILVPSSAGQDLRLLATVFDERTGNSVTGLGAERFSIVDGDIGLEVVSVSEPRHPLDLLMVVDNSIVGQPVRAIAEALIEELRDDEAMAIVAFSSSAELLQDFTSEKQYLRSALDRSDYGDTPRVHDALFAAIDDGFENSGNRRAVVLVSAGIIARAPTSEGQVVEIARAKRTAIYSVFDRNQDRATMRRLAHRTGGASFAVRKLRLGHRELAKRVMEAVRSPYEITVRGVYSLGQRVGATVAAAPTRKERLTVSVLPID